jgi:hypothetical protein
VTHAPYRLRELGRLQFQPLADRLLPGLEWSGDADGVRKAIVPTGLPAWDLPNRAPRPRT